MRKGVPVMGAPFWLFDGVFRVFRVFRVLRVSKDSKDSKDFKVSTCKGGVMQDAHGLVTIEYAKIPTTKMKN